MLDLCIELYLAYTKIGLLRQLGMSKHRMSEAEAEAKRTGDGSSSRLEDRCLLHETAETSVIDSTAVYGG